MRPAYDFRLAEDRLQVGRDLGRFIETFSVQGGAAVPLGRAWDAFRQLAEHLRDQAIKRLAEGQRGVGARILAALGIRERATPDAADVAWIQGYLQALADVAAEVPRYVHEALQADEAAAARARGQQLRRDGAAVPAGPGVRHVPGDGVRL